MKKDLERLSRYLLIIKKLRSGREIPADELQTAIENDMRLRSWEPTMTLRSLQRDIKEINELFGVEIKSRRNRGYYISEMHHDGVCDYEQLLLDFDILASLRKSDEISSYILAEHHRPRGFENMSQLISAIKDSNTVAFDYTFVRHGDRVERKSVRPYFLKESLGLWYLLGFEAGERAEAKLKLFAVDRITNLETCDETFRRDTSIDSHKLFLHSYGIWDDERIPVEHVVLFYSPLDGKFLKTTPLHRSQQILADNDEEFRISLDIRITNDFVMALLARSTSLTVISPAHLRERIADIYRQALSRNG